MMSGPQGYQNLPTLYDKKIYPSADGIRNVIHQLSITEEKVRRLKAEDLIEDSVLRMLEKEGQLWFSV